MAMPEDLLLPPAPGRVSVSQTWRRRPVVHLEGEVDIAMEVDLAQAVAAVVHLGRPVTIDLTEATFLDGVAVRAIFRLLAETPGSAVVIHDAHGVVAQTLTLVGLSYRHR